MPTTTQPPQQPQPGMPPSNAIPPGQVQGQGQALPATGLQQQAGALAQNNQGLVKQAGGGAMPQANLQRPGGTNLNDLAESLARNYGITLGSNPLVDEQGTFQRLPTTGQESVGFQFISQAIADEKNRRQMSKAESALQTGLGQVQSRGRGSLAAVQSGQFSQLAGLYASQQTKAQDFSYFLEQEKAKQEEEAKRRAAKKKKKSKLGGTIGAVVGGVVGTFVLPGIGTAAGMALGSQVGTAAGGYF